MTTWKQFEKKTITVLNGLAKILGTASVVAAAAWGLYYAVKPNAVDKPALSSARASQRESTSGFTKQSAFYHL